MRHKQKTTVAILSLLYLLFVPSTSYGLKEVLATGEHENGIIWDNQEYKAFIDFIRTNPATPDNEADSMYVYFIRDLSDNMDINGEKKRYRYKQSRGIMIKSLKEIEKTGNRKIYLDGVFQKDTVIKYSNYQIIGDLTRRNYSYRMEDGTPLTGKDSQSFYVNGILPISAEFFQALHQINPEWEVIQEQEEETGSIFDDLFAFDKIYRVGPDKTFTINLDKDVLATIVIKQDRMEIGVTRGDHILGYYLFLKSRDPKFAYLVNKETEEDITRLYPEAEGSEWLIDFTDDKIIFTTKNKVTEYKVKTDALEDAIKLARVRGIISEYKSPFEEWLF